MSLAEFFVTSPWALLVAALLLGLMVGSFLNVVIYRLPLMMEREWTAQCQEFLATPPKTGEVAKGTQPHGHAAPFNLAVPRSHCPACGHAISALENIPVLSWLVLRGRCRACENTISLRYPLIEAITALLSALVAWQFGFTWFTLGALILVWALMALTMIDIDHQLLPDDITLPLLWLGLVMAAMGTGKVSLSDAVWGSIGGYGILWAVYWSFKLLTGKEGMGYGDFKLLAALGAWLGWQALPIIILLSALVGAIAGITLIIVKGQDKNIPIPYGPYLSAAGFIALIWGESINSMYFNYVNL